MTNESKEQQDIGEVLASEDSSNDKIEDYKKKKGLTKEEPKEVEEKKDEEDYSENKQHKVIKEDEEEEPEPEPKEESKEEEEEEPEDELEVLKQRNKALMEQLDKMYESGEEPKQEPKVEAETEPEAEAEKKKPKVDEDIPNIKFVTDEDIDAMYSDASKFNEILNKVYKMGLANARKIREDTLKNVSGIVNKQVSHQTTLNKMVDDFYTRNEDLKPYKSFVGSVANELQADNPDMELPKLFEETEREVRNRLKLRDKVKQDKEVEEPEKEPNFAETPGSRVIEETPTPTQQEIDEIVNL